MEGFDIREPWKEGSLFMKEKEYEALTQVISEELLVKRILIAGNVADAAINKMIRG
mgnify:FL=1